MRASGLAETVEAKLQSRILSAAAGNPGLQEILTRPLLSKNKDAAEKAITAVEGFLTSGKVPNEPSAAMEFFRRVLFDTFLTMLNDTEKNQLRATTLFTLPVPRHILTRAGQDSGIKEPDPVLDRLQGLGFIDAYPTQTPHAAINPLARPLVPPLSAGDLAHLAKTVIEPLCAAWTEEDGLLPLDSRAVEAARLALLGSASAEILGKAAWMAVNFLWRVENDARTAFPLARDAVAAIQSQGAKVDLVLLLAGAECAERLGEAADQDKFLAAAFARTDTDPENRANLLLRYSTRLIATGELVQAEKALREAEKHYTTLGNVYSRAVTMGNIADILTRRGELDEALRIRREEELPVYDRLGDVRSRAMTMGKIADILTSRGEQDEALRIQREEVLPVCDHMGDLQGRAVTMGKIADILTDRGELDEALRIRREEQLPVYDRLGDVYSRAVTMGKIADILTDCGELDEALRIHLERLPVAQAMNDIDGIAKVRFSCANIRIQRGGLATAEAAIIVEELTESFASAQKIGRADFIGRIGSLFGQVLADKGRIAEALAVLDHAAVAFTRLGLGFADELAFIHEIQTIIREGNPT